ncbi:MAG: hypothetical protein LBJ62_05610 [Bifidobacteriaceae bacterium]|jgi:beta-glucosidase|nr:hypothetical protein [Bifidobacteriaceae bacterium]
MRTRSVKTILVLTCAVGLVAAGCTNGDTPGSDGDDAAKYTTQEVTDGTTTFTVVNNPNGGTTLAYGSESGIKLIEEKQDGFTYAFKDMNGNGDLDAWEDWRKTPQERGADLAPRLATDQISGLMLFSSAERSPTDGLTDAQKEYLGQSYLRNILFGGGNEVEPVVTWTNQLQAYVETLATGETPYVPVNFSSDPRHDAVDSFSRAVGTVSQWPSNLGLAATFDPELALQFGQYASAEYRALGLTNTLSPQIDLASDPRWSRINGTFGEDPAMSQQFAANYVTGFQTTYGEDGAALGWGPGSVTTVIKHFPIDAAGEGGRRSSALAGEYAVMPGDNGAAHESVFAAAIAAGAGGIMPSYPIVTDANGDPYYGNLRGSAYDKVRIDIARAANNFDGVMVTDWQVTRSIEDGSETPWGTAWGAGDLTVEERHFEILKAGVDQFGGNTDVAPVRAAYDLWEKAYTAGEVEVDAPARWAQTGSRVLTNFFAVGLYDNPFTDLEASKAVVGNDEATTAGQDAQHKSVVRIKDDDAITCGAAASDYAGMKVYIPRSYEAHGDNYTEYATVNLEVAEQYFAEVVTDEAALDGDERVTQYTAPDLSDVDLVIVGMKSPQNGGFDPIGHQIIINEDGSRTFLPISLQYRPYTADGPNVRRTSIAGDRLPDGSKENRSYYGNTAETWNAADLDAFERAVAAVEASGRDIPIITVVKIAGSMFVPTEFEADSDAILLGFSVTDRTLLDVALGIADSSGRLPIGLPASMDAVEGSFEDLEKDVESYTDSTGNVYQYGFGLTCQGSPIQ